MNWTRRQDINQTLTAFSRTSWIQRWMEVAGRIWASYWLLICGSFLVVGSVVNPQNRTSGGYWDNLITPELFSAASDRERIGAF